MAIYDYLCRHHGFRMGIELPVKAKKLSHQFFSIALIAFRLSKIEKYPQLYLLLVSYPLFPWITPIT